MRKVAIVGLGQLPMKSRYPDKLYTELAFEATKLALEDAGITNRDVDSAIYSIYNESMMLQSMSDAMVHEYLGLKDKRHSRVVAGASTGGHAIKAGFVEVASGYADLTLIVAMQKGSDLIDLELMHRGEGFWAVGPTSLDWIWHSPYTITVPSLFGLTVTAHIDKWGTPTEEQIAKVSVKNHLNAMDNPYAQLKVSLNVEEVLNSRLIAWPSTMYECCLYSEGATTLVLASEDKAKQISKKPIWITGVAATSGSTMPETDGSIPSIRSAAQFAYRMAGIKNPLEDFDLMEVCDLLSAIEILSYEELQLCALGEAGKLVDDGVTEKTGKLPVNRSGGRVAAGHVAGVSGVFSAAEVTRQLREEAGDRQVPIRKGRGLVQTLGGPGCAFASVNILER